MSILVIFWFILLLLFDIYTIYIFFRKNILKEKFEETRSIIPTLGHKISINGMTGKGKTTSAAGIIMVLTEYDYNLCNARMEDIRLSLPNVDFNLFEKIFSENYEKNINFANAHNIAIDCCLEFLDTNLIDTFYTDFLGLQNKREMIIDYFLYYWVIKYRGVLTYSTGSFYNFVSKKLSKRLDPTSNQLRKMAENRNYQGGWFSIKFNDEKSIEGGNEKSNNTELRNSGVRDYLALKRHEGKGSCFDISPAQIATDVNAQERRLNDVNIDIFDRCDDLANFKLTRKILEIILKIFYVPIWIFLRIKAIFKRLDFIELKDEFSKKTGFYRKFEAFIDKMCKLLKRQGYIRVRCKVYYKADDVGKKNPDLYDKYIFYFPIYYCYGVINTYEYASVMKQYASMNENSIDEEISQFDDEEKFDSFNKTINN